MIIYSLLMVQNYFAYNIHKLHYMKCYSKGLSIIFVFIKGHWKLNLECTFFLFLEVFVWWWCLSIFKLSPIVVESHRKYLSTKFQFPCLYFPHRLVHPLSIVLHGHAHFLCFRTQWQKISLGYFHSTRHHDILNLVEKIFYFYSNKHKLQDHP